MSAEQLLTHRLETEGTPSEQVERCIQQIEATHDRINAVVQRNFDEARQLADKYTKNLEKNGPKGHSALYGMPCTIKDNIQVEGFPFTAGLVSRKDTIAQTNASVVTRMREAGMIPLGLTNVPEALLWYDTDNKLYGRTYNPWDLNRSPGGSSGGESSVIAAGGSPIGMGGDIGGSIRNPANFCGIVGHKPSPGLIPETGTWGAKAEYTTLKNYKVPGPLGRSVAEVRALMEITSGPDGIDQNTQQQFKVTENIPWNEITVYWYETNKIIDPDGTVCDAIFDSLEILARRGCRVERWQPVDIERTFDLYVAALKDAGSFSYVERLGDGRPVSLLNAWKQTLLNQSQHILPGVALATYEAILERFPKDRRSDIDKLKGLQYIYDRKLGKNGLLISPSWPHVAPRIGTDVYKQFFGFTYCALYNILEMPATVVPVRQNEDGLPIGVQIAGAKLNDALTLQAAECIEQEVGRFYSPLYNAGLT